MLYSGCPSLPASLASSDNTKSSGLDALLRRKRDPDPFSIYVCMNIIRPHGRIKVGVNQMQWGKITKSSPWTRRQDPQYCTCILNAEEWAIFGVESAIHGPSHLSPLL